MSREDEIKARLEKATKGPWKGFPDAEDVAAFAIYGLDGWWVAETSSDYSDRTTEQQAANCDFIAHAPADIQYLQDELKKARAEVERLIKQRDVLRGFVKNNCGDDVDYATQFVAENDGIANPETVRPCKEFLEALGGAQ